MHKLLGSNNLFPFDQVQTTAKRKKSTFVYLCTVIWEFQNLKSLLVVHMCGFHQIK